MAGENNKTPEIKKKKVNFPQQKTFICPKGHPASEFDKTVNDWIVEQTRQNKTPQLGRYLSNDKGEVIAIYLFTDFYEIDVVVPQTS